MKISIEQVKEKISFIKLEQLAKHSAFQKRKARKIDIISLMSGFWMMMNQGEHSLSIWSRCISLFCGKRVSKQALDKRLRTASDFGEQLLSRVLEVLVPSKNGPTSPIFSSFNRVYVEDSSTISLPKSLANIFPGSRNMHGEHATAKVQLRLNLVQSSYSNIDITPFRHNDQGYSKQILDSVQKSDLVIRDMGYWSLKVFAELLKKQAYFLTRYRYGTHLFDSDGQPINLVKKLNTCWSKKQTIFQASVFVGSEIRLPVRLVAIKVPQQLALKRKRKAKKDRDRRLNHTKAYYDLLEWNIFVTNVEQEVWSSQDIYKAYRLRWRIEIIFKCWKSGFKVGSFFKKLNRINPARGKTTIYLLLASLALFYARWYSQFLVLVYEHTNRVLSPLKFTSFCTQHFWQLLIEQDSKEQYMEQLAYYYCYEKRKRKNYFDWLWQN